MSQQPNISPEIKKIALSAELYDKSEKIGNIFGLHIDQIGELDTEIRSILIGKKNSANFIVDIIKNLEINRELADKILIEVNKEIFSTIKLNFQSQTESDESVVSSIENAGNFSIEKEEVGKTNGNGVTYADRAKILNDLENPPGRNATASNFSTPIVSGSKTGSGTAPENYTEPLVDYLLANPIAQSEKKIVVETKDTVPQAKIAPTTPVVPKKQGPDPYREAVK